MQVKVISLHPPQLGYLETLFPNEDVSWQRGVDVRPYSLKTLIDLKFVTPIAAYVIETGRKWHHELTSKGAIGLMHANRLALLDRTDTGLLLFEDDFVIHDEKAFLHHISLAQKNEFDFVVFNPFSTFFEHEHVHGYPAGWSYTKGLFHGLHAVYFSPRGRARIGKYLSELVLDGQIDSVYGLLSANDTVQGAVVAGPKMVTQSLHFSSIQTLKPCLQCDMSPSLLSKAIVVIVVLMLLFRKGGTSIRSCYS